MMIMPQQASVSDFSMPHLQVYDDPPPHGNVAGQEGEGALPFRVKRSTGNASNTIYLEGTNQVYKGNYAGRDFSEENL